MLFILLVLSWFENKNWCILWHVSLPELVVIQIFLKMSLSDWKINGRFFPKYDIDVALLIIFILWVLVLSRKILDYSENVMKILRNCALNFSSGKLMNYANICSRPTSFILFLCFSWRRKLDGFHKKYKKKMHLNHLPSNLIFHVLPVPWISYVIRQIFDDLKFGTFNLSIFSCFNPVAKDCGRLSAILHAILQNSLSISSLNVFHFDNLGFWLFSQNSFLF